MVLNVRRAIYSKPRAGKFDKFDELFERNIKRKQGVAVESLAQMQGKYFLHRPIYVA